MTTEQVLNIFKELEDKVRAKQNKENTIMDNVIITI
jgi:hypothetical protein